MIMRFDYSGAMIDVLCIGHAAFDVTMSVGHHPNPDEKLQATAMQSGGGGPAANAAVQVARLGGRAGFCGYLGTDLYGGAHVAEFESEGVDLSLLVRGEHPSPVSQILAKPDGARSVVNFKGDTPWLPADAVDVSAHRPKAILFDGHEPLLSEKVMNWAEAEEIPTVLDAGSLHQGTELLAMRVTYLVASEKFAGQYCHTPDMDKALAELADQRDNVVITLGEKGLIWSRNGATGRLDAFPVDAIDSTGAGDAFHGAFACAVAQGMGWEKLLRYTSAAGALTCTRLGARQGLPFASEVEALLKL